MEETIISPTLKPMVYVDVSDELLREAARITGVFSKTALVHRGLEILIQRESARMLARLGGSMPGLKNIRRRRLRKPRR